MRKINTLLLLLIIGFLFACEKDDNEDRTYSFMGKVQKGPFITGTNVALYELNSNLSQTGRSFTTTITADDGSFNIDNIQLNSGLVLLNANGFYFTEIYGRLSDASLTLQSVSDLSGKESININVLTHIAKGRIENLVSTGMSFDEANEIAKSELYTFLGVTESISTDFDNLDISVNDDYNAVLLSFSIILQRYTTNLITPSLTAELTQLLSNLSADFAPDGLITDQDLIDTLLYNISQLNLIDIRNHIESRYLALGQSVTIPDFEMYIAKFQEKHSENLYTDFTYPAMASPDPVTAPTAVVPNILVPSDTLFELGAYSLAAIIPLNSSLTVKFISDNNYNYALGGIVSGWELINEYPNGFTINSQRQNELMSMLLHFEYPSEATIEYYENESETPTFTKQIRWE
jgi:hypothetical protein